MFQTFTLAGDLVQSSEFRILMTAQLACIVPCIPCFIHWRPHLSLSP